MSCAKNELYPNMRFSQMSCEKKWVFERILSRTSRWCYFFCVRSGKKERCEGGRAERKSLFSNLIFFSLSSFLTGGKREREESGGTNKKQNLEPLLATDISVLTAYNHSARCNQLLRFAEFSESSNL